MKYRTMKYGIMKICGAILTASCCAALLACTKTIDAESEKSGEVKVRIEAKMNELPATRTFLEDETTGKVGWNATGEVLKIIESYDKDSRDHIAVDTEGYVLDGDKATFSFTMTPNLEKDKRYYTAVYPNTAYNPASNSTAGSFRLTLPSSQTPAENSWDPKADLMRSQATSTELADSPTLSLIFTRIVSVNKMTLRGLTAGEKISTVTVSASKALAGNCTTNLTGTYVNTSVAAEKTITLDMSGREIPKSEELVCWFTSYPAAFGEGDTMTVTATTDEGCTYTKEVAFSTDKTLEFKGGEGTRFSVSGWTKTLRTVDFTAEATRTLFSLPKSAEQTSDKTTGRVGGYEYSIAGRNISDANQITYYAYYNKEDVLYSLYFTRKGSVASDYQYGLVELPSISGYALKSLSMTSYASSAKTYRICSVSNIVPNNNTTLGTLSIPGNTSTAMTMEISNAEAGKSCWLWIPLWAQFRNLTATYEQVQ